jgi:hypothetical protein
MSWFCDLVVMPPEALAEGRVLYLGCDPVQQLLRAPLPGIEVHRAWPMLSDGGLERIRDWLRAHRDAGLIAVDCLDDLIGTSTEGLLSAPDVAAFGQLAKLAWDRRLAVFRSAALPLRPAQAREQRSCASWLRPPLRESAWSMSARLAISLKRSSSCGPALGQ